MKALEFLTKSGHSKGCPWSVKQHKRSPNGASPSFQHLQITKNSNHNLANSPFLRMESSSEATKSQRDPKIRLFLKEKHHLRCYYQWFFYSLSNQTTQKIVVLPSFPKQMLLKLDNILVPLNSTNMNKERSLHVNQ